MRAGVAVENARVHGGAHAHRHDAPAQPAAAAAAGRAGLTIAARFRAAGEASDVGGDFYDLFSVDGGWMVVIGDVTGKGPEAAAITVAGALHDAHGGGLRGVGAGRARAPQRGARRRPRAPPDLHRGRGPDRSAPDGSVVVSVACGGHPAPFRLRGGRRRARRRRRPAPRRVRDGRWPETVVRLAPGRQPRALHRRRHGHARGRGPLRRRPPRRGAGRRHGPRADEIANRVDKALVAFEEGPQRDDVALLVLQATGAPASAAGPRAVGAPTADRAA